MANKYEISSADERLPFNARRFVEVTRDVFRSFTGPRKLNGQQYDGPIYELGSRNLGRGVIWVPDPDDGPIVKDAVRQKRIVKNGKIWALPELEGNQS